MAHSRILLLLWTSILLSPVAVSGAAVTVTSSGTTSAGQLTVLLTEQAAMPSGDILSHGRMWIRLDANQRMEQLSWHVDFGSDQQLHRSEPDQPTADDARYLFLRDDSMLSYPAVELIGELQAGTTRLAELLIRDKEIRGMSVREVQQVSFSLGGQPVTQRQWSTTPPQRTSVSAASENGNENLLIITGRELRDVADSIASYHRLFGHVVTISEIEHILQSSDGRDNPERFRNWLRMQTLPAGTALLLVGDEQSIPIRLVSHLTRSTAPTTDQLIPCDLYYADLTGDWNLDGDSIWGEPYGDGVDLIPELRVGRLPIRTVQQGQQYLWALHRYWSGEPSMTTSHSLNRALFFTSDQLRDYGATGQHGLVSASLPDQFIVDTISGVEASYGSDPQPTNMTGESLALHDGISAGLVFVQAHGSINGFIVRSSGINQFPKSYLTSDQAASPSALLSSVFDSSAPSFWHSIACDNGAIDKDSPPFTGVTRGMPEVLLGEAGAVGLIAYSRWGWVNTSYLMQRAFLDSLKGMSGRSASAAMYAAQRAFPYYRDLLYGQVYFGDPLLRLWQQQPRQPQLEIESIGLNLQCRLSTSGNSPVATAVIRCFDEHGVLLAEGTTDQSGSVALPVDAAQVHRVTIQTVEGLRLIYDWHPPIATDVDDEPALLPNQFSLHQNYPNPFNPTTTISFELPSTGEARLVIFNLLGQEVARLIDHRLPAGEHRIDWDGTDSFGNPVATGLYWYRLTSGESTATRSMLLLK